MGAPFSWSASRHDTFASCRRRYYFSYYAALEDEEIRRLKKLSALPLWAGSLVHDTIEQFLRANDALPSQEAQDALVRATVHSVMAGQWRESEQGSLRFRLFEHEYGVPVEQEDKRFAVTVVMRSLRHFFRSEALSRALAVGRSNWLALEDLVSFHVGETEVFLRMDLAYRETDGRVVIVDWKTGRSEGRFNEVQVAGYALYAAEQGWVGEPEEITTELDYLMIPKVVRRTVTRQKIDDARRFVQTSAATMKALLVDPLENTAREEDFPRVERPRVCGRCNFRRLCFPRGVEPVGMERAPGALTAAPRQVEPGAAVPVRPAPVGDGAR